MRTVSIRERLRSTLRELRGKPNDDPSDTGPRNEDPDESPLLYFKSPQKGMPGTTRRMKSDEHIRVYNEPRVSAQVEPMSQYRFFIPKTQQKEAGVWDYDENITVALRDPDTEDILAAFPVSSFTGASIRVPTPLQRRLDDWDRVIDEVIVEVYDNGDIGLKWS